MGHGRTVLATDQDGFVHGTNDQGLWAFETRLLSRLRYLVDGRPPVLSTESSVQPHTWLGYYLADLGADLTSESVELRLTRHISGGMHEDVDMTNFTQHPVDLQLELQLDADFADSTRPGERVVGEVRRHCAGDALTLGVDDPLVARGVVVRVVDRPGELEVDPDRIVLPVHLEPRGSWHVCVEYAVLLQDGRLDPAHTCHSLVGPDSEREVRRSTFLTQSTRFAAPQSAGFAQVVLRALDQARADLAALRLDDLDHGESGWTMAAGMPVYLALFGRDTLTASWQAALLGPEMMRGTLKELPRWQGRTVDDWREEQPGRMLHEAHTGPLSALGRTPLARHYASVTTSGFYPVVVSELWHWTGDEAVVRPLVEPALAALRWLDEFADVDGDGFYEYLPRSAQGPRHQAWKDSDDGIVDEHGARVDPPVATCEEQGFVYVAKLHLAEVLWRLGNRDVARRLFREARELKKRFNEAFWMDSESCYALGLDKDKHQIRSVASNGGHCLAAGIATRELASRQADRLFAADLFSGWGVRTLSSQHPAYNPYSYHRGSVWPVEQGAFAIGFMRYGLPGHAERIARATFDAAALFDHCRLPELFSGHARTETLPFPALYPRTCWPQAWSSSTLFALVQSMLGLYPYAPSRVLLVDPHLPEWLPELELKGLRVGEARVTLRFWRDPRGRSHYRVEELDGRLHVVRQPSTWSLTATVGERARDVAESVRGWI